MCVHLTQIESPPPPPLNPFAFFYCISLKVSSNYIAFEFRMHLI